MTTPRGGIKESTSILTRIDNRLFPNDLRHIKLALVDHCIDADIDPSELTISVQLLDQLLPHIQLQNDAWLPMSKCDLNTSKVAIKGFYDCVRHQLNDLEKLKEKIQEAKEDQDLC